MGIVERIKSLDKKQWFILLLIFLLGFGIRGHLLKYPLMFEFDSYYHARQVSYILEDGFVPAKDPLAYYQIGYTSPPQLGAFFWYFTATFYKVFTLNAPYNQALWIEFVKILPALFGALTAIALFFFGKEIYGKRAGYAMAIFAATVPAYVYRTMAGFFEDDSLGFLWMIIAFVFFIRAIKEPALKKQNLINAVLAGIFLGIMAWSWAFFLVAAILLLIYFIFAFFHLYTTSKKEELKSFFILWLIVMGLFTIISYPQDKLSWINLGLGMISSSLVFLGNYSSAIVTGLIVLAFIAIVALIATKKDTAKENRTLGLAIPIIMFFFVLMLAILLTDPNQMFEHKFRPPVITSLVGEESFGFPTWGHKFNAMVLFPILALVLIPLRLIKKKEGHLPILIYFWVWITLFMAFYKLQYTFTFGLPVAAAAGVIFSELFLFMKDKKMPEAKLGIAVFILLLLTSVAAGSYFVTQNPPSIESWPGWKDTLYWMKDNLPEKAKLFNWWNEGHWLTFIAGKQVLLDNRNMDTTAEKDYGMFVTTTDLNKGLAIIKKYNPDYLVMGTDLFQSQSSMLIYAYWSVDLSTVPELQGKLAGYYGFDLDCSKESDKYSCSGNVIPVNQYEALPIQWTANPSTVQDGKLPLWYYKSKNNDKLFVIGPVLNYTMHARLWFNEPEIMKYFEEVYESKAAKIFKVNKQALGID
ncbi:MAG: STT3 domain-containing protein [archaeon]|mgnify:CR=1 FL=1